MNCSHITLLFNVKTSSTSSVTNLAQSIILIPTSSPLLIPPLPLISPRRLIAFLPTSIWHRVQMLGRRVPSMIWREVFLRLRGFDQRGTILRTRYDIPFTICGDIHQAARSDVCLVHLNSVILLVVQEDKTMFSPNNPEPQIVAGAIATFQHNNQKRADLDLPQLDMMIVPCITMVGTRPFFYQIPVTQQLSDCVVSGQFPSQPTVVRRCTPPARRRASESMEVPDYRRIALQYYDAFRGVAKDCWATFLDGCD